MDVQRTKESSDACQRSSSSQVDVFKAFLHAMAGESHDRAARVGTFGGAVQVVDGVFSGGQTGGVLACGEAWSRKKETRLRLWLVHAHARRRARGEESEERRGGASLIPFNMCSRSSFSRRHVSVSDLTSPTMWSRLPSQAAGSFYRFMAGSAAFTN